MDEYQQKFATPYRAAHRGFVDEVIMPSQTRQKLIRAFKMLENKVDDAAAQKARQYSAVVFCTELRRSEKKSHGAFYFYSVKLLFTPF
ncbi:MAG: carboxyl transferase domain-containing protein [Hymenobacter sp.]